MEERYSCRYRKDISYIPEEAKKCGNMYQDNKCRFGGYCSVLETKLESFELPEWYRPKNQYLRSLDETSTEVSKPKSL